MVLDSPDRIEPQRFSEARELEILFVNFAVTHMLVRVLKYRCHANVHLAHSAHRENSV